MSNENNMINNLPSELKIQLDILANENHTTVENLVINILSQYVSNEFSDCDDSITE